MSSKNRFFADDGWAFWVTGEDVSTIYLNEWINPRGRSYVDIAMRVRRIMCAGEFNLYIPFFIEKDDIDDISHKLQDRNIFRAVFSATGIMDVYKNACTSEMAYHGRAVDLVHISRVEYSTRHLSNGTLINLSLEKLRPCLDNDEAYFLFRIPHKSLDAVFAPKRDIRKIVTRLRDLVTSPVVAVKYGYSVRINEARLLPDEITRIGSFHRQKLNKAVVTISVDEDYQLNDANCYRIHRMEETLYRDYAPEKFSCENVITYQWNQNRDMNERGQFNFYFDISRQAISKTSLFIYLFIILLVGFIGDGLWKLATYLLGW